MNASRLLIATACSLVVAGTASMAFAQTVTPGTPSSTAPNQNLNQGQITVPLQVQTPSTTTAPGTTVPGSVNSTTPRTTEAVTPGANTTVTPGTTGPAATRSADGTLRTPADRATMDTERAARADRN